MPTDVGPQMLFNYYFGPRIDSQSWLGKHVDIGSLMSWAASTTGVAAMGQEEREAGMIQEDFEMGQ